MIASRINDNVQYEEDGDHDDLEEEELDDEDLDSNLNDTTSSPSNSSKESASSSSSASSVIYSSSGGTNTNTSNSDYQTSNVINVDKQFQNKKPGSSFKTDKNSGSISHENEKLISQIMRNKASQNWVI